MKSENLARSLGEIDEELIYNAVNDNPKANRSYWKKLIPVAACICLAAAIWAASPMNTPPEEPEMAAPSDGADGEYCGPTAFEYNGRLFIHSSYSAIENELPEGYTEAGTANIGGLVNVPFFVNPDIPEWVYAYQEVRTTGEVDESNTLIPAEPHGAYVLYVDERLRGDDLIAYNGDMYISLWSADYYGDTPDVTKEYYDYYEEKYGLRIEGEVPDGFELAGTAVFTGHNGVPKGELASNIEAEEVYFSPDDPDVLAQTLRENNKIIM